MEIVLAKVWEFLNAVIPAAIGSALAIYINKEKNSTLRKIEIFAVWAFGIAVAHYLGGATIIYAGIDAHGIFADAVKFTVGLLGMVTLTVLIAQVPDILKAIRVKFLGE